MFFIQICWWDFWTIKSHHGLGRSTLANLSPLDLSDPGRQLWSYLRQDKDEGEGEGEGNWKETDLKQEYRVEGVSLNVIKQNEVEQKSEINWNRIE